MANKDRLENEFYSLTGFTHAGIKVSSGERFIGKDKRFSNVDLDYLEKRGRIVDFTSNKDRKIDKAHIEDQHDHMNRLIENPFNKPEPIKEDIFKEDVGIVMESPTHNVTELVVEDPNMCDVEKKEREAEEPVLETLLTDDTNEEISVTGEITPKKRFNRKNRK